MYVDMVHDYIHLTKKEKENYIVFVSCCLLPTGIDTDIMYKKTKKNCYIILP